MLSVDRVKGRLTLYSGTYINHYKIILSLLRVYAMQHSLKINHAKIVAVLFILVLLERARDSFSAIQL